MLTTGVGLRQMEMESVWGEGGQWPPACPSPIHSCLRSSVIITDHPLGITGQPDQSKNVQLIFCSYPGP